MTTTLKEALIRKAIADDTPVAIVTTDGGFYVGMPEGIDDATGGSVVRLRYHGFVSAVRLRQVDSVRRWDEPAEEVRAPAHQAADMLRARIGLGPVAN